MIKRWLTSLLVMLGTAVVLLVGTAVPAHASKAQCQYNHVCFWKDAGFSGQFIEWVPEVNGSCWNVPGSWNDIASSGWNTIPNKDVLLYIDANCVNYFTILPPNDGWSFFAGGGNDKMTSFRFTIHCPCLVAPSYPSPDPNARTLPEPS